MPASVFGPGSRQSFDKYFEGESCVRVGTIDDIVAWLQTCEYVTDLELFREPDVWQHPAIFENGNEAIAKTSRCGRGASCPSSASTPTSALDV